MFGGRGKCKLEGAGEDETLNGNSRTIKIEKREKQRNPPAQEQRPFFPVFLQESWDLLNTTDS